MVSPFDAATRSSLRKLWEKIWGWGRTMYMYVVPNFQRGCDSFK